MTDTMLGDIIRPMNDDALYEEVARELQAKTMVPGVWAKAFAEAGGDLDKARAFYIKHRVTQLAEVRNQRLQEDRQVALEARRQRMESGFRRGLYALFAVVFGILTLFFVCGIIAPFIKFSADNVAIAISSSLIAFLLGMATHKCSKASQR